MSQINERPDLKETLSEQQYRVTCRNRAQGLGHLKERPHHEGSPG